MKFIILTLTLASLAGCAIPTMNDLRQEEPRRTLYSNKASKVIADCVQHEWQNLPVFAGEAGATQQAGSNGIYTVATVGSSYFVDIQAKAPGSEAKYYASTYRWISRQHLTALQGCL